jgi:very-short-patch-repair endonuclease
VRRDCLLRRTFRKAHTKMPSKPTLIRDTARRLRREQTEWEHSLWARLRRRQLNGFKFRRQHPIGPFFADFFCREAKLVIEIDGSQHADELARDESRTEFLRDAGYNVLRFWNHEIRSEIDAVLQRIGDALEKSSTTRGRGV